MYLQNEEPHFDLIGWLDTIESLGVNLADTFPAVIAANQRVDRLQQLKARHQTQQPDIVQNARRLGLSEDLDNETDVLALADHTAYGQDTEHRERVSEVLDRAADFAREAAVKRFRRSDILSPIRPAFDALAARITVAAAEIPEGVLNLDDATRLGHSDAYLQLERDLATWDEIAGLIRELHDARILDAPASHWPLEFMLDDVGAYREHSAGLERPRRRAAGIAAGQPRLHLPASATSDVREPHHDSPAEAYYANQADREARAALGLAR